MNKTIALIPLIKFVKITEDFYIVENGKHNAYDEKEIMKLFNQMSEQSREGLLFIENDSLVFDKPEHHRMIHLDRIVARIDDIFILNNDEVTSFTIYALSYKLRSDIPIDISNLDLVPVMETTDCLDPITVDDIVYRQKSINKLIKFYNKG